MPFYARVLFAHGRQAADQLASGQAVRRWNGTSGMLTMASRGG